MGIEFNNNYGIDRKEWKALKKELKAEAKENSNVDFNKKDVKELKAAIKSGDLSAYLDQIGQDMQGIMGLKLSGKVDGTEDLKGAAQLVNELNFAGDVDKAKVVTYIMNANAPRIAEQTQNAGKGIEDLRTANDTEDLFATLLPDLDKTFGIA